MARKSKADIRPFGLSSFERTAWLAKRRRAADRKELAEPTEADIAEMRLALRDYQTFARLPDDKESLLFCAMLTIREQLKIYGELVKFEDEPAGQALSALIQLGSAIPNASAAFRAVTAEMSEERGITVPEAQQKMVEFSNMVDFLLKKFQGIVAKPDRRKVRSRHMRHETAMVIDCLERLGVHASWEESPGTRLAVRIVRYTSGRMTGTEAFWKMAKRARKLRHNS